MKKFTIKKSITIKAPKENVWRVLVTPKTFAVWGSEFSPNSAMKGEWKHGGSVSYFDDTGMGLTGKVIEFVLYDLVSVEYTVILRDFKPAPDLDEGWIGCKETYQLIEKDGVTQLDISTEVPTKEYYDQLDKLWDKVLSKIKELAEKK